MDLQCPIKAVTINQSINQYLYYPFKVIHIGVIPPRVPLTKGFMRLYFIIIIIIRLFASSLFPGLSGLDSFSWLLAAES